MWFVATACIVHTDVGDIVYQRISPVTQAKINALLVELRSWDLGEHRNTLHELSVKFDLDVFVVDRLASSEGLRLSAGTPVLDDEITDPNAITIDLEPEEIRAAAERPDPNPEWDDKDEDTGVWKQKPTGEWELIKKS